VKKVIIYSVLLVVSFAFFIFILNLLKPEGILSKIKLTNTTKKEMSAVILSQEKRKYQKEEPKRREQQEKEQKTREVFGIILDESRREIDKLIRKIETGQIFIDENAIDNIMVSHGIEFLHHKISSDLAKVLWTGKNKANKFYAKWIPVKWKFDKEKEALNKKEFETKKQIFIEVYKDELRDDEKAILGMPEDIPKTKRVTKEERQHLLDGYLKK